MYFGLRWNELELVSSFEQLDFVIESVKHLSL